MMVRNAHRKGIRGRRIILKVGSVQGNHCYLCGGRMNRPTLDHILPRSKGGTCRTGNIALACVYCNSRKGDRDPLPCEVLFGKINADLWRADHVRFWHRSRKAMPPAELVRRLAA